MAAKKRRSRTAGQFKKNKQRHRANYRFGAGRWRRFMRALSWSTLLSFVVSSWALHSEKIPLEIAENLLNQQLVAALEWEALDKLFPHSSARSKASSSTGQAVAPSQTASASEYYHTQFSACPEFFPQAAFPIVPKMPKLRELCFSSFAILYSGETKTPIFVAQRMNRSRLEQARHVQRTDRFYEEARLPKQERAKLEDYKGSGYDRGHMAPAGDMYDEEGMAQSFSLANIVPQDPRHNRGAWSKIEGDTRKFVARATGQVYIFTGPIFEAGHETIGAQKVAVPKYLYKLVYDASNNTARVHWHENAPETVAGKPISYEKFQQHTGLNLLPMRQNPQP